MIIVVGHEKGGVGKSTLAINIASRIHTDEPSVVLVDTDTSASSSGWSTIREHLGVTPALTVVQRSASPGATVVDLAGRYDAVVCDMGAGDYQKLRDLTTICDLLIAPTQVGQTDLESTVRLWQACRKLDPAHKKGHVPMVVASNRAPVEWNNTEATDAREALQTACNGIVVLDAVLRDRKIWRDAGKQGRSIFEMPPRDSEKAVKEFDEMLQEALRYQSKH